MGWNRTSHSFTQSSDQRCIGVNLELVHFTNRKSGQRGRRRRTSAYRAMAAAHAATPPTRREFEARIEAVEARMDAHVREIGLRLEAFTARAEEREQRFIERLDERDKRIDERLNER